MKKIIALILFVSSILSVCVMAACGEGEEGVRDKSFIELISEITGEEINSVYDVPYYFTVGADDSYCTIDTNPSDLDDYSSTVALRYIIEMNILLDLPDYLYNDMIHTSYSQGIQEAVFDKFRVRYYYHPDKGLNVTYYRIK